MATMIEHMFQRWRADAASILETTCIFEYNCFRRLRVLLQVFGYGDEVVLWASESYDPLAKFYGLESKKVS